MDVSYLIDPLNDAQREAVCAPPGHYLVLAGAGSGKTRVLTHRIGWLIEAERRAAMVDPRGHLHQQGRRRNARHASRNLIPRRHAQGLTVGTFHGIAHRLLRRHWREARLPETFQILDADDQQRLVKRVVAGLGLDEARFPPRQACWQINHWKDEGKRPDGIEASRPSRSHAPSSQVYQAYEEACRRAGLVDFAELLLRAHELWLKNPAVLRALPAALAAPADRRIPGHQRAAVRVDPRARRATPARFSWSATTTSRSTAGAAPRSRTCSSSCRISRRAHHQAGTELPLHRDHPESRQRRDRAQRPRGSASSCGPPATRASRIALYAAYNEQDEARFVIERIREYIDERRQRTGLRDPVPLQRAVAQLRGTAASSTTFPIASTAASASSSAPRSRTRSPTCGSPPTATTTPRSSARVNTPPRGIGERTLDVTAPARARRRHSRCGTPRWPNWPAATRWPRRAKNAVKADS